MNKLSLVYHCVTTKAIFKNHDQELLTKCKNVTTNSQMMTYPTLGNLLTNNLLILNCMQQTFSVIIIYTQCETLQLSLM